MDSARALEKVEEYIALLRAYESTDVVVGRPIPPEAARVRTEVNEGRDLILNIVDQVGPEHRHAIARGPDLSPTSAVGPTERLAGAIRSIEEAEEILGPQGPQLSASELHPWVWEEAAPRWDAGFYRDAVQAAATRIFDVELPRKLGVRPSRNPADLFAAFAPDKSTGTVLRFPIDEDDPSWASVHREPSWVGQGAVGAIRNPRLHDLTVREDQVALEELAALSLLARWIDDAEARPAGD